MMKKSDYIAEVNRLRAFILYIQDCLKESLRLQALQEQTKSKYFNFNLKDVLKTIIDKIDEEKEGFKDESK